MFTALVVVHGGLAVCSLIGLGVVLGPLEIAHAARRARPEAITQERR